MATSLARSSQLEAVDPVIEPLALAGVPHPAAGELPAEGDAAAELPAGVGDPGAEGTVALAEVARARGVVGTGTAPPWCPERFRHAAVFARQRYLGVREVAHAKADRARRSAVVAVLEVHEVAFVE